MAGDGFHPNLQQSERLIRNRVHHVKSSDIDADTAQSEGMQRFAAISGRTVGSEKLWMGETHVHPQTVSANHHHGESEKRGPMPTEPPPREPGRATVHQPSRMRGSR